MAGSRGAAWSPDGTRIVTASQDTTARVWEAATARSWLGMWRVTAHEVAKRAMEPASAWCGPHNHGVGRQDRPALSAKCLQAPRHWLSNAAKGEA